MEIKHFAEWKDLPMSVVRRKKFSSVEQERIWYCEWRYVYMKIINVLANYLNRKDKEWDKGLDHETLTTADFIAQMKGRFEAMGFDFEDRVKIWEDEYQKLKR